MNFIQYFSFNNLEKKWENNGFLILSIISILFIVLFGLYNLCFSENYGTWSKNFTYVTPSKQQTKHNNTSYSSNKIIFFTF